MDFYDRRFVPWKDCPWVLPQGVEVRKGPTPDGRRSLAVLRNSATGGTIGIALENFDTTNLPSLLERIGVVA